MPVTAPLVGISGAVVLVASQGLLGPGCPHHAAAVTEAASRGVPLLVVAPEGLEADQVVGVSGAGGGGGPGSGFGAGGFGGFNKPGQGPAGGGKEGGAGGSATSSPTKAGEGMVEGTQLSEKVGQGEGCLHKRRHCTMSLEHWACFLCSRSTPSI